MRLHKNWWKLLKHAWSVRLWIAASVVVVLEPLLLLIVELSGNWNLAVQITLRILAGVLGLLGIWARVVKQKEFESEQDSSNEAR